VRVVRHPGGTLFVRRGVLYGFVLQRNLLQWELRRGGVLRVWRHLRRAVLRREHVLLWRNRVLPRAQLLRWSLLSGRNVLPGRPVCQRLLGVGSPVSGRPAMLQRRLLRGKPDLLRRGRTVWSRVAAGL
jgi:hypothetical protein